jgi:hypothetical protein
MQRRVLLALGLEALASISDVIVPYVRKLVLVYGHR